MFEKMESYMENSFILRQFQSVFNYFSPVTLIVTSLVTIWIINYNWKRARLVRLIEKIPGPPALPIFGESPSTDFNVAVVIIGKSSTGNAIELNVEHSGKEMMIIEKSFLKARKNFVFV
jgi:hypothetical protein